MEQKISSIVLSVRPMALQATIHIQNTKRCIQELVRTNKTLNVLFNMVFDTYAKFITFCFFIILVVDAIFSEPVIKCLTAEGFKLQGIFWEALVFTLYIIVVGAITWTCSEYFALGHSSRHKNLLLDLRQLADNSKLRNELELELKQEVKQKLRIAIGLTTSLVLVVAMVCAFRIFILHDRQWEFELKDIFSFLPVILAILLIFLGRYKGILFKTWGFSSRRRKIIKYYHKERNEANALIDVLIEKLQIARIDLDDQSLPSEIKECIEYFRSKNPFELLETEQVFEPTTLVKS